MRPSMSFAELGICPEILEAREVLGFETPSPIQQQAIPAALEGKDIVGLYLGYNSQQQLVYVVKAVPEPTTATLSLLALAALAVRRRRK